MKRRDFLRAGATAAAASSLFPWLSKANAQPTRLPRLILFWTPHGTVWNHWRPTSGVTNSMILAPLARHQTKINVLDGIRIWDAYDHRVPHTYDMPAMWSGSPIDTDADDYTRMDHGVSFGWNLGKSVDQEIADRLAVSNPFRTLELGVGCGNAHPATRMIYTGAGMPRHPLDNPGRAYDQVFMGFEDPEPDLTALRRRSVLDAVIGDLGAVRTRLGASDRIRLEAHESSLREIEMSLGTTDPVMCTVHDRPMGSGLDLTIDQQSQLLATSIACERTRIASMQVRIADNDGSLYEWAGITSGGHHMTSHDQSTTAQDNLAALYTWYAERFAYLLDLLDAIPDGDGVSVLDNSFVVWGSEIGVGWNHDVSNVPFVVAGGAAGRMSGGRYMDLRGMDLQHNRILVDCLRAMGIDDVPTYGSTDNGTGGVPGLLSV